MKHWDKQAQNTCDVVEQREVIFFFNQTLKPVRGNLRGICCNACRCMKWPLAVTPFNRLSFLFWNNMWRATVCISCPLLSPQVVIEAMPQKKKRRWSQGTCHPQQNIQYVDYTSSILKTSHALAHCIVMGQFLRHFLHNNWTVVFYLRFYNKRSLILLCCHSYDFVSHNYFFHSLFITSLVFSPHIQPFL